MTEDRTPLPERMKLHVLGQITWPEPKLGRRCNECRHFLNSALKTEGKGRCDLVRAHGGKGALGVGFTGKKAIACPQFDAGVHPLDRKA